MPSSSLVEVEVGVDVGVEVGVGFEDFCCCFYFHGWLGGWSEDWRVMLNSTQDQVEVEVKVELGNTKKMQSVR